MTLREAIASANNNANVNADVVGIGAYANDTISFDPSVFSSAKTILLNGTQLELSDTNWTTTITGPAAGVTVSGNNASRVLQVDAGVIASFSGVTISGGKASIVNFVSQGSGLFNAGTVTLTNCTISGNSTNVTTAGSGGGLYNDGTATLTNCTISGNTASGTSASGGGVYNNGAATLTNCTISGNTANGGTSGSGGGLSNVAVATVINCTISGNTASGGTSASGGGVYTNIGVTTLANTIVAGNTGGDLSGSLVAGSSNNLVGGEPKLGPLANYGGPTQTMALLPGSPAIDDGSNALVPSEVQNVFYDGAPAGTFTLQFNGQTTTPLTGLATASQIQTALNNLSSIGGVGGSVTVTGTASPFTVTFGGSLAHQDLPQMIASGSGGTIATVITVTNGIATDQRGFNRFVGTVDIGAFESSGFTITVPGAQTVYEDVDKPISGVSVATGGSPTVTVTLGVSHGKLTLGTTTGLTVGGNGTSSVTLTGATAKINAALATLVYRGKLNFGGPDVLTVNANVGAVSAHPANVAINVKSANQQAADLQTQVKALQTAHVLNKGQANSLLVKLDLKGNSGDIFRTLAFLFEVKALRWARILTQSQADALLVPGNILLISVTRH